MLRNSLEMKANINDLEIMKRQVDTVMKTVEFKSSYKDLEGLSLQMKVSLEEVNKELLLKSSLRDVCTLLDQKAGLEDLE